MRADTGGVWTYAMEPKRAMPGCALVIGDIPSLREIWRDAAIFVPPHDVDAIANALLADSKRLEAMGRRAQKRAATFTPERMANAYRETCSAVK